MLTDDIKNQINDLIQINLDASEGYKVAAKIANADLQNLFKAYAVERRKFADALITEVNKHGNDPEKTSTIKGAIHRTWLTIRTEITSNNEFAVIDECIRGEEAAIAAYSEVIPGAAFTETFREMVIEQNTEIEKSLLLLNEWKNLISKGAKTS